MWPNILRKIDRLHSYDRNLVVEDAAGHRYEFNSPATLAEVQTAEDRLGVSIPQELRSIYLEIGNGGVGPDGGLRKLSALSGIGQALPWPGVAAIEDERFDLSNVCGLMAALDRHPNYASCVVASGPEAGKVIAYEEDAFAYLEAESMAAVYTAWLDKRLALFAELIEQFRLSSDIREIASHRFVTTQFHPDSTLLVSASLLGWTSFDLADAQRAIAWEGGMNPPSFSIEKAVAAQFDERIQRYRHDTGA